MIKRIWDLSAKPLTALTGLGLVFFIAWLCWGTTRESREDQSYKAYFLSRYKVFGLTIPANLSFAGEPVPLNDFTVYENMDRELTSNVYFQSSTLLLHKRASRWFPVIEPILKRNGIPDDFKYVPIIESNLTNSISPKGATGFWQIMEVAAPSFGLEVNDEVDERYNVAKSTEGSCKYLKEAYNTFHNWTLALASFNYGISGLQKLLEEQKARGYYDLLLNEETTRYIFRLLAIKEIINHPKNYGFEIRKKDLYPPIRTYTVAVDSSITDMVAFARKFNLSYKMLKYFNPWLRKDHLTNPGHKKYEIAIPKAGYNESYFVDMNDISREPDSGTYFLESDTVRK
jgi:hypothetical protein